MKLYGHPLSGHAHRPRALLRILGVPFEEVVVDLKSGEHKRPAFLALNPLGQVPVLEHDGRVLRDSTAILVYLARTFDESGEWLPEEPAASAAIQQWLSAAVLEIREGPFALRLHRLFGAELDYGKAWRRTESLFNTLFEPHLESSRWLVGDRPTVADLACYGYIARAHEGDFSLEAYPHLRAWLGRVEAIDNFPAMPKASDL